MNRLGIRFLFVLSVLAVSAVLEVGPRASAAFTLSVGSVESTQESQSGQGSATSFANHLIDRDNCPHPLYCLYGGNGGMTSPDSSSSSVNGPVYGDLPRVTSEKSELAVYLREAAALLYDSALIDSLLDPPRVTANS